MGTFLDALGRRVLVFDGAMGTQLQSFELPLSEYGGLENCSEILNHTRPDVVLEVHRRYLEAGADAVETNSFGANRLVLDEYGIGDRARDLSCRAAELAREACAAFSTPSRPRFAVGSIGPGTRLPSLGHVGWDELERGFAEQVEGLLDGGVDALIVETCQDLLQAKCALVAIARVLEARSATVPVIAQVTIETTGTMLVGSELPAACCVLEAMEHVDVIGINCASGPQEMAGHVAWLGRHCRRPVSVQPNAGLPQLVDGRQGYPLGPEELATWHERFVREDGVSIVGGCCGTGPEHIAAVVARLGERAPGSRVIEHSPSVSSLYAAVDLRQDADVLAVGERTNANGSRRFRRLLAAEDWDGIVAMGREQVRQGSHAVDLCTAVVGRDELADMGELAFRFNTMVPAPLVVDSTEPAVIEAALKRTGGKPVINSIQLEGGEERCELVCRMARRYGAALVALAIDDRGMARSPERKVEVAAKLAEIAIDRHGIEPPDLLFDPLTFTICTGNDEDRKLALWTLDGIERISERFPRCGILLGVSNVSFGLAPPARRVLNSVFLYHARRRGLTAAILHPSGILPLHRVPEEHRLAAEDLVFDRRRPGHDPLQAFLALFSGSETARRERPPAASVELRLRERIVNGERDGLERDLAEALERHEPLEIINEILLDGMKEVGELFGSGRMQLPFVLRSAETMKAAVAFLEPRLAGSERASRGRILLATVRGDVHDIGKNLVDIILSNNGYEVVNLGIKQPVEAILAAAREHRATAIGMSGLLVRSTAVMRENLLEMRRQGVELPVILGGAALTRSFVQDDCTAAYRRPVAYGGDAFAGLRFMEDLAEARSSGEPSRWELPLEEPPGSERLQVRRAWERPLPEHELDTGPVPAVEVPVPPRFGPREIESIPVRALVPFLNEDMLFKFHWGFLRRGRTAAEHAEQLRTVARPALLDLLRRVEDERLLEPRAVYGWYRCRREGDSLVLEDGTRLGFPRQRGGGRCIADYFDPEADVLGLMAVTMGPRASEVGRAWMEAGEYRDYLYLHGLSVEMAEAFAELLHRQMRAEIGISGDDAREIRDLFRGRYRGCRYSYGYPACPDMAGQRHLLRLLRAGRIGLSMDRDEQLHPEQSTVAMVVHHPGARYFRV